MHVAAAGCATSIELKKSEAGTSYFIAKSTNTGLSQTEMIRTKKDDATDGYKLWGAANPVS